MHSVPGKGLIPAFIIPTWIY